MRFGKIPHSITLISAQAKPFKCGWEDIDVSLAEDVAVVPCFAADSESSDNLAQGRKWQHDFNLGHRLDSSLAASGKAGAEETILNEPRAYTVVGLEKRQEGGRSFKVIDDDNRLFDMREDVLLETLLSQGSSIGGRLNGGFVFARIGSQMRLVRVGSGLHGEMLKSEKRRQSKNVATSELVPGGVYANRRGLVIYLGVVDTVSATAGDTDSGANVIRGHHLSIALSKHDQKDPGRAYQNALINASSSHTFQLSKSITTVELISRVEVPANPIEHIRLQALAHVERYMYALTDEKAIANWGVDEVKAMNRRRLEAASALLNLRVGGPDGIPNGEFSGEYKALLARYT